MSQFSINPTCSLIFSHHLLYMAIQFLILAKPFSRIFRKIQYFWIYSIFLKILKKILEVFCNFKITIIITFLYALTSYWLVLSGISQMKWLLGGHEQWSRKWEVGTRQKSPSYLAPGCLRNAVNSISASLPQDHRHSHSVCTNVCLTPVPHLVPSSTGHHWGHCPPLCPCQWAEEGGRAAEPLEPLNLVPAESCLSFPAERP